MPAICLLASCGVGTAGKPLSNPVVMKSGHWLKVRSQPPTYFPKGFPANHPTTRDDGFWVDTGDTAGSRYFILGRGVDTRTLVAEALAAVTPAKRARQDSEDRVNAMEDAAGAMAADLFGAILKAEQSGPYRNWNEPNTTSDSGRWKNHERR